MCVTATAKRRRKQARQSKRHKPTFRPGFAPKGKQLMPGRK